jgi:hypothetical protein
MGNKGVFCQSQESNLTANFLQSILKLAAVKPKNPPNREKTSCLARMPTNTERKKQTLQRFQKTSPRNNWTGSISFLKFGELRKKHQTHRGRGQARQLVRFWGLPLLGFFV